MKAESEHVHSSFILHPSSFEVVVATPDVVGERMAGPGIRATYFAREIAKVANVTLVARDVIPSGSEGPGGAAGAILPPPPAQVPRYARNDKRARDAIARADVLVGQPARGFFKRRRGQRIIYALFDPLVLELRELYGSTPSVRQRIHLVAEWSRLMFALRFADLLVCGASQQKKFYSTLQSGD